MPTYPHGFPDEVIDPFMNRTGRGVLGNVPASGTEIIQELGEEHQRTGKWIVYTSADSVFQIAAHEETIPLEELYEALPRRARDPHRQARRRARDRAAVPRRAGQLRAHAEPARLLARAAAAELPLAAARRGHEGLRRREDPRHLRRPDIDESFPTKSNVEGIQRTEELMQEIDEGFVFVNLVETDMLWGHRNDPENFHRCLQDFDRRLPDLLEALRDGDLLILTSDHGCDPTTPSTDHSREYALLLAYAQGRNAGGRVHEGGEFADVGATVNAWLGGKAPARGDPGQADPRRARPVIRPAEVIQRKRDGDELADDELAELVLGYARGEVPDYQMAAFAMAVYFRGLTPHETYVLTDAMIRSGETIDLGAALGRKVVDKHSTGGVGDKTSLAVGPIVAACGVPFGKMSGRGLGHTGGTLDKLESIPGFRVELEMDEFVAAGARRRHGDHRPDRRPRPGRPHALRAARRDRDGRPALADRGVDHVQEARRGRAGDRARREGRRRRVHEDARRRAPARRGDAGARRARRPRGRLPADRHGPAARRRGRERARGASRRARPCAARARPTSPSSCSTRARGCSSCPTSA